MRALAARSPMTGRGALLLAGAVGVAFALPAAMNPARADEVTVMRTYQAYPGAPAVTTTERHIVAPGAPPALQTEVVPPAPNDLVVWNPGHWNWTGMDWVWEPGHYMTRVQTTAMWQPGHWEVQPAGGYMWVEGHWD